MKGDTSWLMLAGRLLAAVLFGALLLAGAIGALPQRVVDACREAAQAVLFGL